MSFDIQIPEGQQKETRAERRARLLATGTRTIVTSLALTAIWLYAYNIIMNGMHPVEAFFHILSGINELVIGMLAVTSVGLTILVFFTITRLFTQMITNLYSVRMVEDLVRDHLFKREWRTFFSKLIHFEELPQPESPFPRKVSSAIVVFSLHYLLAWFYLVVFTECLYFAAWSAGVYVDLYPESMNTIPMFAIAVPFTARLMAYFKYPGVDDYAGFIPGILFVVVLLLAFVGAMGGPFQYFTQDIYRRVEPGYFQQGALFWKFLREGTLIAFYPVFGEVLFFYLQYQELKRRVEAEERAEAASRARFELPPDQQ